MNNDNGVVGTFLLFCSVICICAELPPEKEICDLHITITNIKLLKGYIELGVFNSDDSFLQEGMAYRHCSLPVAGHTCEIIVANLSAGRYAVSVYHDVNADGKCNRNLFGYPVEPFGFSNNPRGFLSPPSFDECAITPCSNSRITIQL